MIIVQFETQRALDLADDLLATPGVDVAMVGPADLSISLGVSGDSNHPLMISSITRLIEQCQRRGVVPGIHVRTFSPAQRWLQAGMRFVSVGSESTLLLEQVSGTMKELRCLATVPGI